MYTKYDYDAYSCAIGMQKAFDLVNLLFIFQKLSKRPIPILIERNLFHLYFNINLCVSWNGIYSSHFVI